MLRCSFRLALPRAHDDEMGTNYVRIIGATAPIMRTVTNGDNHCFRQMRVETYFIGHVYCSCLSSISHQQTQE